MYPLAGSVPGPAPFDDVPIKACFITLSSVKLKILNFFLTLPKTRVKIVTSDQRGCRDAIAMNPEIMNSSDKPAFAAGLVWAAAKSDL
jgi:hypothetical protein